MRRLIYSTLLSLAAVTLLAPAISLAHEDRDTKRVADIKQLQNAVELYYSEHGIYPLTSSSTNATWSEFGNSIASYITNVPIDPTNDDSSGYVYTYGANTTGTEYFISAKLEDASHAALTGDDDSDYVVGTTTGWDSGVDFVASTDTVNVVRTNMDCGATVLDSVGGMYCASE